MERDKFTLKKSSKWTFFSMVILSAACMFMLGNTNSANAQTCATPTGLDAINITSTSVTLVWNAQAGVSTWTLKGRAFPFGQLVTLSLPGTQTAFNVNNLTPLQGYEWNLRANCTGIPPSATSPSDTFVMDGCLAPDSLWTSNIMMKSAKLSWTPKANAFSYNVFGRKVGTTPLAVTIVHAPASFIQLPNILQANTSYEWFIVTVCTSNGSTISFPSVPNTFTTLPSAPQKNEPEFSNQPVQNMLSIFPNPSNGNEAMIYFDNPSNSPHSLIVSDLRGKIVEQRDGITESGVQLQNNHLQAGIYLVELRGEQVFTGKLVIQ